MQLHFLFGNELNLQLPFKIYFILLLCKLLFLKLLLIYLRTVDSVRVCVCFSMCLPFNYTHTQTDKSTDICICYLRNLFMLKCSSNSLDFIQFVSWIFSQQLYSLQCFSNTLHASLFQYYITNSHMSACIHVCTVCVCVCVCLNIWLIPVLEIIFVKWKWKWKLLC